MLESIAVGAGLTADQYSRIVEKKGRHMTDQHTDPDANDPLEEQIRDEPNPELVRQHDVDQDPLDKAIIEQHEHVEETDASSVQEGKLNPPPVDEYD